GSRSAGVESKGVRTRRRRHTLREPEELTESERMARPRQDEDRVALVVRDAVASGDSGIGRPEEVALRKSPQALAQQPFGRGGKKGEPIAPMLDPALEILLRGRE